MGTLGVGCQSPELFAIFLPVPSLGMSCHVTWKSKLGGLGAERSGLHVPPGHQREWASWADAVTVRCCLACQQPVRYSYDNRLHCTVSQELATEYHSREEEVTEKTWKLESQTLMSRLMCVLYLYLVLHLVSIILRV